MYVGSAEDEKYDQELDDILVGPVPIGKNQFIFQVCLLIYGVYATSMVDLSALAIWGGRVRLGR